jgi:DNA-binding MarR family transcriptional regulator
MNDLDSKIIRALSKVDSFSLQDLAEALDLKPDAVAKAVSRLEKKGLVQLYRPGRETFVKLRAFALLDDAKLAIASTLEAIL